MEKLAFQIDSALKKNGHIVINHYESYVDDIFQNADRYRYVGAMTTYLKEKLLGF
ncbi:hypothetical protein KA013_02765 [Patescibacteria group bacterium]|nr:hypothetical protein [Patescibacteria group bacterium]